jgi:hypothetical protein
VDHPLRQSGKLRFRVVTPCDTGLVCNHHQAVTEGLRIRDTPPRHSPAFLNAAKRPVPTILAKEEGETGSRLVVTLPRRAPVLPLSSRPNLPRV